MVFEAETTPSSGDAPPLSVLVDIVHPAHVLFFANPIRQLRELGHKVHIASRRKDVTLSLLDEFGLAHTCLSSAGNGMAGLGWELIVRDFALNRFVGAVRPDVMIGYGGVAISHVGRLRGVPAIGFYDTDRAVLQQRLTTPFINWQYVPRVYDGVIAKGRTSTMPGVKELSYLHPDNFIADRDRAVSAGLDERGPNFLVRAVSWRAAHDLGREGWSEDTLRALTSYLSTRGRVHVSSEVGLPEDLEKYRFHGGVSDFHHLLAHCDLYVGESATIATEALLLGVPTIYGVDDRRSYIDEFVSLGLAVNIKDTSFDALRAGVQRVLGDHRDTWNTRREAWLRSQVNLAEFVTGAVLHHAYGRPGPYGSQ